MFRLDPLKVEDKDNPEPEVRDEKQEKGEEDGSSMNLVMTKNNGDESDVNNGDFFNGVKKLAINSVTLRNACDSILTILLEENYFDFGYEMGRGLRWGELEASGILSADSDDNSVIDEPGKDIFGNSITETPKFTCECTICNRKVGAAKYARHLASCMGIGRNSSRQASQEATSKIKRGSNGASTSNKF